jgi:ribosomal protein S18 acetylase RimI-like enzyme
MDPLDNPVWHALTGPHESFAERHGRAARYPRDVAPFAAVVDQPDEAAWADLATLIGSGGLAVLFRDPVERPPGWQEVFRMRALQMVAPSISHRPAVGVVELGIDDTAAARELVALTDPGPIAARTIEMGTYVGVRDGGRLVAMAGERMRVPGHHEISLVCTHPDHRNRGLGTALVLDLALRIRRRGEVPFLHVLEGNESATRLYRTLGFDERRWLDVVGLVAP